MKQYKVLYLQKFDDEVNEGYYMRDVADESELKVIKKTLLKKPDVFKVDFIEVKNGVYKDRSLKKEYLEEMKNKG